MRDRKYDEYEAHKEDHEELLDEIRYIMDRSDAEAEYRAAKLSSDLTSWFTRHFSTKDARLHKMLG